LPARARRPPQPPDPWPARPRAPQPTQSQDRGQDTDDAHCEGARTAVASALAAAPEALAALASWAQRRPGGGGHDACLASLQVLHHCCRSSPELAEVVVGAGVHETLLAVATAGAERGGGSGGGSGSGGGGTAALAALALTSVVSGISARGGAGGGGGAAAAAAACALAPSAVTDAAICRLAGELGRRRVLRYCLQLAPE
jgi:hypothetical protein